MPVATRESDEEKRKRERVLLTRALKIAQHFNVGRWCQCRGQVRGMDVHLRFITMCAPQVTRGSRRCAHKSTKKQLQIVPAGGRQDRRAPFAGILSGACSPCSMYTLLHQRQSC
eukprot:12213_2